MNAKRALAEFRAPREKAAEQRAWDEIRAAAREREPARRRRAGGWRSYRWWSWWPGRWPCLRRARRSGPGSAVRWANRTRRERCSRSPRPAGCWCLGRAAHGSCAVMGRPAGWAPGVRPVGRRTGCSWPSPAGIDSPQLIPAGPSGGLSRAPRSPTRDGSHQRAIESRIGRGRSCEWSPGTGPVTGLWPATSLQRRRPGGPVTRISLPTSPAPAS